MGTKQERCSPSAVDWSNLSDDLLNMVQGRVASPLGRVRFTGVCGSWRAAALQHPTPPALPLLVLSPVDRGIVTEKRLIYCPEEGVVLQVPIPSKLRNMQFIGSYDGGWIAAIESSSSDYDGGWMGAVEGSTMFLIVNLFSGVDIALYKIGCLDGWTIQGCDMEPVRDVAFYRGELYGLAHSKTLYTFDIDVNEDGAPIVTAAYPMDIQRGGDPICTSWFLDKASYICEFNGKLAVAVMSRWLRNCKPFFKVFQVTNVDDDAHKYKWEEVGSLGDCALFLGQLCSSKVVQMPAGGRGHVERNHIYYSNHHSGVSKEHQEFEEEYHTKSEYGDLLFHRKDQSVDEGGDNMERILSVRYYIKGGHHVPMWCLPPHF
ncbi:hypothetical protein VPH35_102167 [Triticum aestivum]